MGVQLACYLTLNWRLQIWILHQDIGLWLLFLHTILFKHRVAVVHLEYKLVNIQRKSKTNLADRNLTTILSEYLYCQMNDEDA